MEDEQNVRDFITAILSSSGYGVLCAATGEKAISMIVGNNPDLVLLDLGLLDIDGMKVLKSIREWTDTPIIVVSAREDEHEKVEALDAGAYDYITKPFGNNELLSQNAGKVLTHDFIIHQVWGPYERDNQALRVNMANIRRKLEENPANPQYILTEVIVGYKMIEPE